MLNKIFKIIVGLLGVLAGYSIVSAFLALNIIDLSHAGWINLAIRIGVSLLFGIIFFLLSPGVIKRGRRLVRFIERELEKFSAYDIAVSSIGLIIGLIIAFLLSDRKSVV